MFSVWDNDSEVWFWNQQYQHHLGVYEILGLQPKVAESGVQEVDTAISILTSFPGDSDAL